MTTTADIIRRQRQRSRDLREKILYHAERGEFGIALRLDDIRYGQTGERLVIHPLMPKEPTR